MHRRSTAPLALFSFSFAAALAASACLLDPEKIGVTAGEITATTATTATTEATEATESSSSPVGVCQAACEDVADCCVGVSEVCPGPWPFNHSCSDGVCDYGECVDDSECGPGKGCHLVDPGFWTCATLCEVDADCGPYPGMVACLPSGDGVPICTTLKPPGYGCTSDDECSGVCNLETGDCECSEENPCTEEGTKCFYY